MLTKGKDAAMIDSVIATALPSEKSDDLFSPDEFQRVTSLLRATNRQADILLMLLRGQTDQQIANGLGISASTVRVHLRQLYQHNDVSDRTSLVTKVFHLYRDHVE